MSTIIFELHQINKRLFVKVFFINETETEKIRGKQMKLSGCPDYDCPYDTFISFISKFVPNYKTDCGIPEDFDFSSLLQQYLTITNDQNNYNPK